MSSVQRQLRDFYDVEVYQRAERPLEPDRASHLQLFLDECQRRDVRDVLEVGCGAGRDGLPMQAAGLAYCGVDLSPVSAEFCRGLGLDAREGLATSLPFDDATFDAVWTMSTLMHLEGDGFEQAVAELGRVVKPGGLVEVGVWGSVEDGEWTSPDGRYFRHRSDDRVRELLSRIGQVDEFDTWDWIDDGGHYQWARITTAEPRPVSPTTIGAERG